MVYSYVDNIKVVDRGVHMIYNLIEEFYPDKATSYIFTADHGMSDKGECLVQNYFIVRPSCCTQECEALIPK